MSKVEDAAAAAVAQVRPLHENLVEIERESLQATKYIESLHQRLAADRAALREAVADLVHGAQEVGQKLAHGAPAAGAAIQALGAACQDIASQAAPEVQTEAGRLDSTAAALDVIDPHVTELAGATEAAVKAALQHVTEIEQGLAHAIEAAEQLLSVQLASMLADARRELETATANLVYDLHQSCPANLTARDHTWETKLAEVHAVADKAFDSMERHTKEVTEYTGALVRHLADEQLDFVAQEAQTLHGNLDALGHELTEEKGKLELVTEMLYDSLKQTTDGAHAAEQKLAHVRGRWLLSGFPC